jgi:hypothetical protein
MFIKDQKLIDDAKALGFTENELVERIGTESIGIESGYTLEQLRRWLNIKFGLHICVQMYSDKSYFWIVQGIKNNDPDDMMFPPRDYKEMDAVACELEGVKKAVEYLKEGK